MDLGKLQVPPKLLQILQASHTLTSFQNNKHGEPMMMGTNVFNICFSRPHVMIAVGTSQHGI